MGNKINGFWEIKISCVSLGSSFKYKFVMMRCCDLNTRLFFISTVVFLLKAQSLY